MSEDVIVLEPGDERAKKIGKAMSSPTSGEIISLLQSEDMTLSDITDSLGIPMTTAKYHVENLLDSGMIEVRRIKYSEKGREVKVYGASGQVVIVSAGNKDLRSLLLKYASVFGLLILASLFVFGISGLIPGMIPQDLNQSNSLETASFYSPGYDDPVLAATGAGASENYSAGYSESLSQADVSATEPVTAAKNVLPPPELPEEQRSEVQVYADLSDNGNEIQEEAASEDTVVTDDETGGYKAAMLTVEADMDSGFAGGLGSGYPTTNLVHMMVLSFFFGGCMVLVILMLYEALIWKREKNYWQEFNMKSKSGNADNISADPEAETESKS